MECAGCKQPIPNKQFLICSLCEHSYDLICANVSEKRFYNTLTPEHRRTWKCQACRCNMPKKDNSDTPIRAADDDNITLRRKAVFSHNQNTPKSADVSFDDQTEQDLSLNGDTIIMSKNCQPEKNLPKTTLDYLCGFLTDQLEKNKLTIVNEIKAVVQEEIALAISSLKSDFTKRTDYLAEEQKQIQGTITELNKKILSLETQLNILKNKSTLASPQAENSCLNSSVKESLMSNSKKMVLHGLDEYYGETEDVLYNRVVQIFYELLNINLDGYIEQLTRIGRRGHQRPLEIELISKRITKNVLEQSQHFKNTPFTVTEFLTTAELKKRRELRKVLQEARNNGKYAIIKNSRLYINGEEYTIPQESKENNYNMDNSNGKDNKNIEINNSSNNKNSPTTQQKVPTAENTPTRKPTRMQSNQPFRN